jgi:hypothetical protein
LRFHYAWADHEQRNSDFDVLNLAKGTGEGWAVDGHGRAGPRLAVFFSDEPFGYAGGSLVTVKLDYKSVYAKHLLGKIRLTLGRTADLLKEFPLVMGDWWRSAPQKADTYKDAFDKAFGPEKQGPSFQRSRKHGWAHAPKLKDGVAHGLSGERSAFYFARSLRTPIARRVRVHLGSDDGLQVYLNGAEVYENRTQRGVAPDQDTVLLDLVAGENILLVKVVNNEGPGAFFARFSPESVLNPPSPMVFLLPPSDLAAADADILNGWLSRQSPKYAAIIAEHTQAKDHLKELDAQRVPVPIMKERTEPTPTYVLSRGNYEGEDRTRPVGRTVPEFLKTPFPKDAPLNRLGYAQWLASPEHPLFARVHVNRIWQMLFGSGLVATSENFGVQADWPSHLELLDYLAIRFRELGFSHKALLRELVTSATYRQESRVRKDVLSDDPSNRLLAYFPRRRLQAELLRDQALMVSGLLNRTMMGSSVKPYQPMGLWREVSIGPNSNTQIFVQSEGEDLYRRSLYTFWKRTSPNPQMMMFDAPTREFCVVRRSLTNTPLQTLVLWNDVQFFEAARALAERAYGKESEDCERIQNIALRCTARRLGDGELHALLEALKTWRLEFAADPDRAARLIAHGQSKPEAEVPASELAAWTMLANVFLNLDATVVRP